MSWIRHPFDAPLFEGHALPAARALLRDDLAAFSEALRGLAAEQRLREPEHVAGLLRMLGPIRSTPSALAELAEDLVSDRLLTFVSAQLPEPSAQRALLLISGMLLFEDPESLPACAKEALRSGRLPGMSAPESALFALVPLVESCQGEEAEDHGPPPEDARSIGLILDLPGDDWQDVEPFCGRTLGGWIWYKAG